MCRSEWCTHRWVVPSSDQLTYVGRQRELDRQWRGDLITSAATYSNSVTITADVGWSQWNAAGTSTATMYVTGANVTITPLTYTVSDQQALPPPTPEQLEADRLARAERRERRAQEEVQREAAKVKAEALLVSCLTQEQQAELVSDNRFHVTTTSGRRYCINRGRAGNVTRPVDRRRFCIHDYADLPEADTMLAQKLLLEADEEAFLSIANASAY